MDILRSHALGRAVAAWLVLWLIPTGCGRRNAPSPPPPPAVTVSRPVVQEVTEWDEYPGRLAAVDAVNVQARISGYIERAPFDEGRIIEQGTLLFVIDKRPFEAELKRAEAQLAQAQAQRVAAANEFERIAPLGGTGAASEVDITRARQTREAANATVAAAQAAVQVAELNVEWCEVRAPIAGRVGRKNVTPGNLVTAGAGQGTLLTTITAVDPIYCYVDVDERTVRRYQRMRAEGKRGDARAGQIPAQLAVGEEAQFNIDGHIDFVDNRIDPDTGTIQARGVFPNPTGQLLPGYYARLRIPGTAPYRATLVPETAIGTTLAQQHVLVVGPDDVVQLRPVKTGTAVNGLRVVQGIEPDARVVVAGLVQARPGAKVRPQEAPAEAIVAAVAAAARPTTAPADGSQTAAAKLDAAAAGGAEGQAPSRPNDGPAAQGGGFGSGGPGSSGGAGSSGGVAR